MISKKLLFILFLFLVISSFFFGIAYLKKSAIEEYRQKSFVNIVEQSKLHLRTLIKEKQNTTATIGLGLSTSETIINALKNNDTSNVNLNIYSTQLRQSTDFKNVWFQLISKEGISMQRSWTDYHGDNIAKFRIDVQDVLDNPRLLNSISVGKFDMTFKSIVPIYDNKNFLGVIEVITHFNSISKKLSEKGVDAVILADKKYKKQLIRPFSKKFIGDYYVANIDINDNLMIHLKSIDMDLYIKKANNSRYFVDKGVQKLVTYHYISDINHKVMGHFLLFIDLKNIDTEKENEINYVYNLYIMLTLVSFVLLAYFIYTGVFKDQNHDTSYSKKLLMIVIIAYIVLSLILYKLISLKYQSDVDSYKNYILSQTLLEYKSILDKNKGISELIYSDKIDIDSIKQLIKDRKRKELYDKLIDTYKALKIKYNVRQLHFHLPESISFLRMHRPEKHGDSLKGIRESVDFVQKYHEPYFGFEEGRIYNGFRYVFPLFLDEEFLGSVEVSFDIYSIMDNYFNLFNVKRVNFLLSKDIIQEKVFASERSNYIKSPVDGFYFDRLVIEKLNKINKKIVPDEKSREKLENLAAKIHKGTPFIIHFENVEEITVVIPFVNKVSGKVVGSINISKPDAVVKKQIIESQQVIIAALIVLALMMVFLYREIIVKLKLKNEFYKNQKILDSQKSFIIISDGKSIKASNRSMVEFFGFKDLKEFQKEHGCICDFFEYEEGKNYIQQVMNGKSWFEYLKKYDGADKIVKITDSEGVVHLFYIEFNKKNIIDNDSYIITFIDITKLKNIENQLVQSEKMASLGKMMGNIAHQWRQPLSVISTAASGIKIKDQFFKLEKDDLYKNMDMIVANAVYLSETIDTFRDIIKDKKTIKEVVIQDTLDNVFGILVVSLNNKNITLVKNIVEKPIVKRMVVGELSQVLTNIINNASDALKQNQIKDACIIVECKEDRDSVIISVEDNAGGVPEDIIDNIFEPYFTTKHQSQGTGLGLYMSHKIVEESLGGKLYVENTDRGAKFFIKIPLEN